ncbi:MAG: RlmE family RNA methyltransferase [Gammaproteobacteria bacterium]|jgi:23S rRNA (uridine2552-2'-O)-methyltransferase|nr:RlmE family RNA methyltransferase [Gammaproteobacteria bacterium]MBT4462941.1 RlmE family RNA methyltransferase [Gammaproteobacteria bacterium]MBT4654636.1 RlmE family RNA methyltransferase [Gammaproteobacteria bacterium]MBT5117053.1 RlmE family RNA methyltransferase [Gammaproteobacteria bacterium]MBT5761322.1 RlmE family RNA methyltransferase [Gammaproteobacteria bacterium]
MTKVNKTSNWVRRHSEDAFVKKSKQDKYRSRAAYKLKAIDEKYNLLKKVSSVADLGCAPGSWLQVLKEYKNINFIVGIDLLNIIPIDGVHFAKQDISSFKSYSKLFEKKKSNLDLVLSDIAPNITGISDIDQSNFSDIASNILGFCRFKLKPEGSLIMKYFLGSSFESTLKILGNNFNKTNVFKPASSKKKSNEVYLICIGFKD